MTKERIRKEKLDQQYQTFAVAFILAAATVVSMAMIWQRKTLMLLGVQ